MENVDRCTKELDNSSWVIGKPSMKIGDISAVGTPLVQWIVDKDGVFILSEGDGLASLGLVPGEVVGMH